VGLPNLPAQLPNKMVCLLLAVLLSILCGLEASNSITDSLNSYSKDTHGTNSPQIGLSTQRFRDNFLPAGPLPPIDGLTARLPTVQTKSSVAANPTSNAIAQANALTSGPSQTLHAIIPVRNVTTGQTGALVIFPTNLDSEDAMVKKYGQQYLDMTPEERIEFRMQKKKETDEADLSRTLLAELRAGGLEQQLTWKYILKAAYGMSKVHDSISWLFRPPIIFVWFLPAILLEMTTGLNIWALVGQIFVMFAFM